MIEPLSFWQALGTWRGGMRMGAFVAIAGAVVWVLTAVAVLVSLVSPRVGRWASAVPFFGALLVLAAALGWRAFGLSALATTVAKHQALDPIALHLLGADAPDAILTVALYMVLLPLIFGAMALALAWRAPEGRGRVAAGALALLVAAMLGTGLVRHRDRAMSPARAALVLQTEAKGIAPEYSGLDCGLLMSDWLRLLPRGDDAAVRDTLHGCVAHLVKRPPCTDQDTPCRDPDQLAAFAAHPERLSPGDGAILAAARR